MCFRFSRKIPLGRPCRESCSSFPFGFTFPGPDFRQNPSESRDFPGNQREYNSQSPSGWKRPWKSRQKFHLLGKKPQIPPKPLQRPRGALPSQSREECRNSRHDFPVFPKKLWEPRRKFPIFYSFPREMLGAENNPIFLQFSQRNFRI